MISKEYWGQVDYNGLLSRLRTVGLKSKHVIWRGEVTIRRGANMTRRSVVSWLCVALAVVALIASVSQALGPDPGARVTLKTATGEEKEITVEELEVFMETENAKQQAIQTDEAGAEGKRMHERLSDIEKHDPHFARMIKVSRRAFQVIQRHGYAKEYELKGFSERDLKLTPQQLNEQIKSKEERMVLALRAKKSYTNKDHSAPEEISFEVDLLVFEDDGNVMHSLFPRVCSCFLWQLCGFSGFLGLGRLGA